MTFEQIVRSIPAWITGEGPEPGLVLSSRARFARNLDGIPYAHKADNAKLGEIVDNVLEAAEISGYDTGGFFKNDSLIENRKEVFIERHLMSSGLARKTGNRGVLVIDGETGSIMINEEDHLRIQSMRAGLDLYGVLDDLTIIEKKFSRVLSFSCSKQYGYHTACPTNMGTGLRISVLIHLPALVLTKEIHRVIRSAGQLGLAVRGYRGEGSDVVGNMFQISNQASMGKKEKEIVQSLATVVNQIMDYESKAGEMLMKEAASQVEDKIWRSVGLLKTARVLSSHEFMNLSSAVRLGLFLKILDKPSVKMLNELMIITQPCHIQEREGRKIESVARDAIRADLTRERLIDVMI